MKREATKSKKRACALHDGNPYKLDTLENTRAEMARIYRLTLQGKIELEKMTKLIFALKEIRTCIEMSLLDEAPRRLAELEARLEEQSTDGVVFARGQG